MIWFLFVCFSGSVCTAPVQMPSERACHFVGKQMEETALSGARHGCSGVRKDR